MHRTSYLIALGSNRRHVRHGGPAGVVRAAVRALEDAGLKIIRVSAIRRTPALGPAGRDFANAAAWIESSLEPPELLDAIKKIERAFGRRASRRWGARVLDLDIVLWSQGTWPDRRRWRSARRLAVPHRAMAERRFVLDPAAEIAPDWRHAVHGLRVRHLAARLRQSKH